LKSKEEYKISLDLAFEIGNRRSKKKRKYRREIEGLFELRGVETQSSTLGPGVG